MSLFARWSTASLWDTITSSSGLSSSSSPMSSGTSAPKLISAIQPNLSLSMNWRRFRRTSLSERPMGSPSCTLGVTFAWWTSVRRAWVLSMLTRHQGRTETTTVWSCLIAPRKTITTTLSTRDAWRTRFRRNSARTRKQMWGAMLSTRTLDVSSVISRARTSRTSTPASLGLKRSVSDALEGMGTVVLRQTRAMNSKRAPIMMKLQANPHLTRSMQVDRSGAAPFRRRASKRSNKTGYTRSSACSIRTWLNVRFSRRTSSHLTEWREKTRSSGQNTSHHERRNSEH